MSTPTENPIVARAVRRRRNRMIAGGATATFVALAALGAIAGEGEAETTAPAGHTQAQEAPEAPEATSTRPADSEPSESHQEPQEPGTVERFGQWREERAAEKAERQRIEDEEKAAEERAEQAEDERKAQEKADRQAEKDAAREREEAAERAEDERRERERAEARAEREKPTQAPQESTPEPAAPAEWDNRPYDPLTGRQDFLDYVEHHAGDTYEFQVIPEHQLPVIGLTGACDPFDALGGITEQTRLDHQNLYAPDSLDLAVWNGAALYLCPAPTA